MRLNVLLELGEEFGLRVLVADPDVFRTVVAYDATPQSVVHVECESLFVPAVDRLDDACKIERKIRNSGNAQSVLISVPIARISPLLDAVDRRDIVDVVDKEILVGLGILTEPVVKSVDEVQMSVNVRKIAVSEKSVVRLLEIVLDYRALESVG